MGKFTPHAIFQRKGKRGSVVREGEKGSQTNTMGIAEENWRNFGNTGSSE
jgi:hypothetical protein